MTHLENRSDKSSVLKVETEWEIIEKDLEDLLAIYEKSTKGKFQYELIRRAKDRNIDSDQYHKFFKEFYSEKNILINIDSQIEKTSLFSLLQKFTTLAGAFTVIISIIMFLPTQQGQIRTDLAKNKIEQERANYEAWGIINGNRSDNNGSLIQASSGRITALQNLNKNRVTLQGLEVPKAFLLNIDLGGADLYRANFQGTDLYRADFSSKPVQTNSWFCNTPAKLTQIWDCKSKEDLKKWQTQLERVNFRGAILYGTKFNDKDLDDGEKAESDINLFRADFSPVSKKNIPLNKIPDLLAIECFSQEAAIQCTRAVNAEFIGANLKSANFTKANLKGANFAKANLECVSFRGAIFNSIEDKDPNLPEGVKPTSFVGANLTGADFRDLAVPTPGDKKRGLSIKQIQQGKNWEKALYSPEFLKELGLSVQSDVKCPAYDREPI